MTETKRDIRLLSGNEACVEGAIAAGVRFFAGYPITPSSEIAEGMARRLPEVGGKFIQMEDEIASLAAVIGASLAGVKAMDATSGPGLSLKAENLGLAIMLEVPLVLVNVQRMGPSTGMATMSAQGDVMMARWGTHGDHPAVVLAPSSVKECFDLTVKAVNLSEKLRMPVILLSEAYVGHLREKVEIPTQVEVVERLKPTVPPGEYKPYKPSESGVPPLAAYGDGYHFYANSSMHDEAGFETTGKPEFAKGLVDRLFNKVERHRNEVVLTAQEWMEDAEVAIFAFGSVARSARAAVKQIRAQGGKAGLVRAQTLWPFPDEVVADVAERVKAIVVAEMNRGQIIDKVREVAGCKTRVISLTRYDTRPVTPDQMVAAVKEGLNG